MISCEVSGSRFPVGSSAKIISGLFNKALADWGDKVSKDEKTQIETAIKELEEVMKSDDKDAIEAKTKVLVEASGKIAERAYQQSAQGAASGSEEKTAGAESAASDDVVDAEFEEVKDDSK